MSGSSSLLSPQNKPSYFQSIGRVQVWSKPTFKTSIHGHHLRPSQSESPRFRPLVLYPPSPLPGKSTIIPTSATTTQSGGDNEDSLLKPSSREGRRLVRRFGDRRKRQLTHVDQKLQDLLSVDSMI